MDTEAETVPPPAPTSLAQRVQRSFQATAGGWRAYARQDVLFAAVALALLYLTVMSFVRDFPLVYHPSAARAAGLSVHKADWLLSICHLLL